ncbi:MAG: S8 family serine peptidase, partial [Acidobacteriota bacterium]|nr:S8 family serine peptidase [Acidobacteriota bacterium]
DLAAARLAIARLLIERRVIATHYQHVDGTSFAAPITASVVAQMIEANPRLTPAVIKNILISTASRLAGFPAVRQGYGVVCAASAVSGALNEHHFLEAADHSPPRIEGRQIVFSFHDHAAGTVALTGDFNGWNQSETPFHETRQGIWRAAIACQPAGRYRYKFLVDGHRWVEDRSHGLKEDDGYGGFNSILAVT